MTARPPLDYAVLADADNVAHRRVGADEDTALIVVDAQGIVRHMAIWREHEDHPGYQAVLQTLRDISHSHQPR